MNKEIKAVIDFGVNPKTVVIYYPEHDNAEEMAKMDLLGEVQDLSEGKLILPPGSLIISEDSHLGCIRTDKSKAQPYDKEQLTWFYEVLKKQGVELRLFPQKLTPRARGFAGESEKSDEADARSIYQFLTHNPRYIETLKKPKVSNLGVDEFRQEVYDFKNDTNIILNIARASEDSYNTYKKFLHDNHDKIYSEISDNAKCILYESPKILRQNGKLREGQSLKCTTLSSILALLIDEEGNLRIRESTGAPVGVEYAMRYILGMTPHHLKGGVARSNIFHHGFRAYVNREAEKPPFYHTGKKLLSIASREKVLDDKGKVKKRKFTTEELELFEKCRKQYCKAVRNFFQGVKRILYPDIDSYKTKISEKKVDSHKTKN